MNKQILLCIVINLSIHLFEESCDSDCGDRDCIHYVDIMHFLLINVTDRYRDGRR